jgi:murein L,D-transpeptidase YcbB/YkuD
MALAGYRTLAKRGGWPLVPDGPRLGRADAGARVAALQARLAASGDLPPPPPGASDRNVGSGDAMFDATLEEAVRAFQRRHGLDVDGVVGSATLGALNVPLSERVRQIEANLERWRWLPQDLGRTHLLVNIADQRLQVVEQGETVLDMAVIVGRTYRRTPVFTGRMTYLVFNPTWEVPPALAVQDKLPELQADPVRMVQLGFQVLSGWGAEERVVDILEVDWSQVTRDRFPYRLRQLPGPQNALGRVKFMFPNKFNVYLHDTPARELFGRSQRTFSSGCIRVERPEALGVLLLSGQPPWTRETVLEAMDSGREQTVKLDVARPVHLLYWTAWTEPDGTVQFRSDIYGRDRLLEAALAEPPPTSP